MNFIELYLQEAREICSNIDCVTVEKAVLELSRVREKNGRLFILGCGGSAGHASHAVNDFRKICGLEAYCPTDNVSELTARINDDGWNTVFTEWLNVSNFSEKDCLLIFSVGGGDEKNEISVNIIEAIKLSKTIGAKSICIVGKADGFSAINCEYPIVVPIVETERTTPHSEAFAAVIWHAMVSHPKLKIRQTKWEEVAVNSR